MTSLQAAILDETSVAQAHVRSRADSIRASIGAVRETFENIGIIQNVSSIAGARVRAGANAIQARLIARGVTFVARWSHLVAWLTGTGFRGGADTVEASVRANRFTSHFCHLVSRLTLADSRRNANSTSASSLTAGYTLAIFILSVPFITFTLFHPNTPPSAASSGTAWNAELVRLIQLVSVFAHTNSQLQIALSIVTTNRTRGDALSLKVVHKVRIAGTSIRSHAQAIVARFRTDRVTLAEVVNVSFVALAAHLDATE